MNRVLLGGDGPAGKPLRHGLPVAFRRAQIPPPRLWDRSKTARTGISTMFFERFWSQHQPRHVLEPSRDSRALPPRLAQRRRKRRRRRRHGGVRHGEAPSGASGVELPHQRLKLKGVVERAAAVPHEPVGRCTGWSLLHECGRKQEKGWRGEKQAKAITKAVM